MSEHKLPRAIVAPAFATTLPHIESLRRRADFARVLRYGRRARQGDITLAVRPNGQPATRVGYAVGRRVGGAVVRNRVRRRLRALVRAIVPLEVAARTASDESLPGHGPLRQAGQEAGWDIVITAHTDSSRVPIDALGSQLEAGLRGALGLRGAPGLRHGQVAVTTPRPRAAPTRATGGDPS